MRHLNSVNKLNRTASHRKAMLANLAMSVLDKERVITTVAKAKTTRGVVERLITFAKQGGLNSIRVAAKTVTDKDILKKLFSDIGPSYKTREGGYTRILKLGERFGDNAQTCIFELTGRNSEETARNRKKKRKVPGEQPETAKEKSAEPKASETKPESDDKEKKKGKQKAASKRKKKSDAKAEEAVDDTEKS
jgi:large subunit ribosomal protein L17